MGQFIALLPMFWAGYVAYKKSPEHAYLYVYLPMMILIPDYFKCVLPVLPDPTANMGVIVAIAGVCVVKGNLRWRFSVMDVLVLTYAGLMSCSEFLNKDSAEAQNLGFEVFATIVLPYLLTKMFIEPKGLRIPFAKQIVVMTLVVVVLSMWEFRMGRPLFKTMLLPLFPGQGNWTDSSRYGFTRVAGPYGHAILAGIIFAAVYRIAKWLEWTGEWSKRLWWVPTRPTVARLCALGVAWGSIMTLCRGPWIGAFLGAVAVSVGHARNRKRMLTIVLVLGIGLGVPAVTAFKAYVDVGRSGAATAEQETAAYRKELLDKYSAIALERPMWGWGRAGWPKVPGMDSTDNAFLLLALNHGFIALGVFATIVVVNCCRLFLLAMRRSRSDPAGSLAYSFFGCYVMFVIALATVYHGEQTIQYFFIITGWADGLCLGLAPRAVTATAVAAGPAPMFRFQRVLS